MHFESTSENWVIGGSGEVLVETRGSWAKGELEATDEASTSLGTFSGSC